MSCHLPVRDLLKHKKEAKKQLASELFFPVKGPLLGIFLDQELDEEGEEKLMQLLDGVAVLDVNVVILTDEGASGIKRLSRTRIKYLSYNRVNRKKLLEAANISLSFDFNDIEEMLFHGTTPVSKKRPEIADYDPNHETGNSFIYKMDDPWSMFAALVRALETFKFPYDWRHIVEQGVESVGKK